MPDPSALDVMRRAMPLVHAACHSDGQGLRREDCKTQLCTDARAVEQAAGGRDMEDPKLGRVWTDCPGLPVEGEADAAELVEWRERFGHLADGTPDGVACLLTDTLRAVLATLRGKGGQP